jgi:hypothetical protein
MGSNIETSKCKTVSTVQTLTTKAQPSSAVFKKELQLTADCCSYALKEIDPFDISKIVSMSDHDQAFFRNDIDELPKVCA